MNYLSLYEGILDKIDRKTYGDIDFRRGIRYELMPQFLPKNMDIIYDKQMFLDFKPFLISKKVKILEKPWLFHSMLKELKSLFLVSEYKELKSFLKIEFRIVLDETSDKMGKLKFASNISENNILVSEIMDFLAFLACEDEEKAEKQLKIFMKTKGFTNKAKEDHYRAYYRTKEYCFEDYVSDLFQYYFENLKKFPYESLKVSVDKTIDFLSKRNLIRERTKERLIKNKEKYIKEYKALVLKLSEGGEIIAQEFKTLGLKITKEDKEDTKARFVKLAEIIKGFDFMKHGIIGVNEPLSFIYFGSFKSGFALKASDIDTTILTNSAFNERDLLTPLYEYLQEYKARKGEKFELENRVKDNIRIPIIKFTDKEHDFKADIAVNNVLGVANSSLIKIYSQIDKRCKIMGLILKNWAKKWKITSEDSMSSYALILMLIYFLQLKKILPSLQKISKLSKNQSDNALVNIKRTVKDLKTEEFETDFSYERDLDKIRKYMKVEHFPENSQNLLELLMEFFYFYSDKGAFRYYRMKVNIISGDVCFKNTLTEEYTNRERNFMFSIKDPFDKMHNPGDRVKKIEKIKEINYHIDTTIQELESNEYIKNRYRRFFQGND